MNSNISYGGIGTAVSILLLAMAVYMPSGKIALVFSASLVSYITSFETERKTAVIMYFATSLLAFLMLFGASPVIVLSYIVCFGNYPVFKIIFDSRKAVTKIILKLAVYTIYFSVIYLILVFLLGIPIPYNFIVMYFAGIVVFVGYDYLISYAGGYVAFLINKNRS